MAFAIYFEPVDFGVLADGLRRNDLPVAIRQRVTSYWNAGLRDYATAPVAHAPGDNACPACVRLVITTGTRADFIALMRDVATALTTIAPDLAGYLNTLSIEVSQPQGCQDPYP
jgi:hypothetical protein